MLGLALAAPMDAMKKAFRAKAKALHPDHGGDTAQFQKLAQLWADYLRGGMRPVTGMTPMAKPVRKTRANSDKFTFR